VKATPGINAKLRAARTKLEAFKRNVHRFTEGGAYEIRPEYYADPRDPSLYKLSLRLFKKKRFPASQWSICIDETTYHLRSALDAAVYDLSAAPNRPDPTDTGFPIALSEDKFKPGLIRYLTDSRQAFIKSVQPYDRPDDPLWLLHEINRRNKHRAMHFAGVIVALDQQSLSNNLHIVVTDLELVRTTLRAAIRADEGAEFMNLVYRKTGAHPHVQVNMNLQIDIQFAGRTITSDSPVGGLMSHIVSRVEEIISTLYSLP